MLYTRLDRPQKAVNHLSAIYVSCVLVQAARGTLFLLSQFAGSMRLIPAQQLGEHNGAHESGHDCPGQLRGARPGEGGAWGTGFGAYNKEGHIKV